MLELWSQKIYLSYYNFKVSGGSLKSVASILGHTRNIVVIYSLLVFPLPRWWVHLWINNCNFHLHQFKTFRFSLMQMCMENVKHADWRHGTQSSKIWVDAFFVAGVWQSVTWENISFVCFFSTPWDAYYEFFMAPKRLCKLVLRLGRVGNIMAGDCWKSVCIIQANMLFATTLERPI